MRALYAIATGPRRASQPGPEATARLWQAILDHRSTFPKRVIAELMRALAADSCLLAMLNPVADMASIDGVFARGFDVSASQQEVACSAALRLLELPGEPAEPHRMFSWSCRDGQAQARAMPESLAALLSKLGVDPRRSSGLHATVYHGSLPMAWLIILRASPFAEGGRQLVEDFLPHLRARLILERDRRESALYSAAFAVALDVVPCAAFLVDPNGAVRRSNDAGRQMLERGAVDLRREVALASSQPGEARRFMVTPLLSGDQPTHFLAVATQAATDLAQRVDEARRRWRLTARQAQVLASLAHGHANKQIAEELGCAEGTVELHVTALLRKGHAENRAALIAKLWSGCA